VPERHACCRILRIEAYPMVNAHFFVNGERRETREVEPEWLERVQKSHENVLLADGNPYHVVRVEYQPAGSAARVDLAPPEFARAS